MKCRLIPDDAGASSATDRQIAAGSRRRPRHFGKPPWSRQRPHARRHLFGTLWHHPTDGAFGI